MADKEAAIDFEHENEEILSRLDILSEYKSLGVVFPRERVKSNNVVECYAAGREESSPSAGVNVVTGRYFDKGGANESLSLWDFAAKYGGQWSDWREARRHFAQKAGVDFGGTSGGKANGKGGGRPDDRLNSIRWLDWNAGREMIARIWGRTWKKGITLEALKLAGGRFGEFPIWRNKETGEESGGEFKVIGVPAFRPSTPNRPCCWILWNATGPHLPLHRGQGREPELLKMRTVGDSAGTLMNALALDRLAEYHAGGAKPKLVIKTGGPTDMLAIQGAIPPEWHNEILVVTNASGEGGEVSSEQTALLNGLNVLVIGDRDYAGTVGVSRWLGALGGDRRSLALPYQLKPKHGQDARDFINGVRT